MSNLRSAPGWLHDGLAGHVQRSLDRTVVRFQTARKVTILETGQSTYVEAGLRLRQACGAKRSKRPPTPTLPAVAMRDAADILPRVERDPCVYCGVRRDVGCRHHPKGE